ncbi:glycosyltransferase [Flaviramulus aquimarinus]|uniref:Glycosyltransferase n=1 Tax=Flaviramulus aquimarinus TaxID=1170456 RepID=A0ABP9EPM5_9FLAO
MRVLQLIDSLETGGAERVAVNIANALVAEIETSFLCTTRKEGLLKESLSDDVGYVFLNKIKTIDFGAIKRLNRLIRAEKINIIHAHSSSFFLATIMKLLNNNVSVVWHDHYGNSDYLNERKFGVLKFCSKYFNHIFSVNRLLEAWAVQKLKFNNVSYLPNFASVDKKPEKTILNGISGKRIVCLANLRPQKDHFTLLEAFKQIVKIHPEWTLHCIGKDFNDEYSRAIASKIKKSGLTQSCFLYGSKPDIFNILNQCEIGVLSSKSEGLPVALLEYGLSGLAVVATKVGECGVVITNNQNGLLVKPSDANSLFEAISLYIENETLRNNHSTSYKKNILENYSEKTQLQTILNIYSKHINLQ